MGTTISTIKPSCNTNNLIKTKSLLSLSRYSTATQSKPSNSSRLFQRINPLRDPKVSILPVLDQWITEGNKFKEPDFQRFVRELRASKRYSHALQLCEWVNINNFYPVSSGHLALQLDLIGVARGLDAAECFFDKLSEKEKDERTYGALLNCYVREGLVDKSLLHMQKMKEIGYASSPLVYNNLMCLYSRTGQLEKIPDVLTQMKENGISPNNFSYRICINSYGERSDFDSMQKTLEEMECQPHVTMDWTTYSTAVNHYIRAEQKEKALVVLKKLEAKLNKDALGYNHLISHYANLGNKNEVMRLWGLQKVVCKKQVNRDYITMLGMLGKLGEIEESEIVLKEWASSCQTFDFRVPNVFLIGLCSKGLVEKAETTLKNIINTGKTPIPNSWAIISLGYKEVENMEKAFECMKEALAVAEGSPGWRPKPALISSILHWLGEKGEIAEVEAFVRSLRSVIAVNKEMYHALIKANVRGGIGVDEIIESMQFDNIDIDEGTEEILGLRKEVTE
ncbi:hypothetical protein DCAR_0625349 [Daucus carota subsp. sativus]|uniref:Uncharacterized protein n=1 Tax=Daucus carota subsp. sativus TaxID=79200 RepID=A0A164WE05_DAUCS|nr:PREDICTED: pentatricopeptide repeat-containing protein At4g21705, mitochondrial-like [Daucus carota subsp. sativus]XP_017254379.1 PREDICTED: pentatricopeptide repeat-containing protein At4g21705, mitochondrial-like [Daucus carota subsp. sativus]XP_017254380.1 PREDICTED: pentatricopeptide repeat-containing protein At4g21705, mitochondrial-like [Daucus carota subsp. sativus]XP_017254381.1 PREDICTED: pentatricopeptide repeat-containing protein At4g21705, mitochondrial-like [Daucus carota subsp. 